MKLIKDSIGELPIVENELQSLEREEEMIEKNINEKPKVNFFFIFHSMNGFGMFLQVFSMLFCRFLLKVHFQIRWFLLTVCLK